MDRVRLVAVGDICLETRNKKRPFEQVKSLLANKDILFGNLETALSEKTSEAEKSVILTSAPRRVVHLSDAGFDVLNVANNHILDTGPEGLVDTLRTLKESGLISVGAAYGSFVGADAVISRNGMNVGFLGYTEGRYKIGNDIHINRVSKEKIIEDIDRLKKCCDIVVVSLHWGIENVFAPSPQRISLSRGLIDVGATVILGHHPHRLQGIEEYKRGIIIYSLGNFQFPYGREQWDEETVRINRCSVICSLELAKSGVLGYELTPVVLDEDYVPVQAKGGDRRQILSLISEVGDKYIARDLSAGQWFEGIAESYLKQNLKSFSVRLKRFGVRHVFHLLIFLLSPFRWRCYAALLRLKARKVFPRMHRKADVLHEEAISNSSSRCQVFKYVPDKDTKTGGYFVALDPTLEISGQPKERHGIGYPAVSDNLLGQVAIFKMDRAEYPVEPPYSPPALYPEYPFKFTGVVDAKNQIYASVRESMVLLGLDRGNFGKENWNPLGEVIRPGQTVVIKPNLVRDYHESGGDIYSVITHPSIVRAVLDYVFIALKGRGKVIVADAPQGDANFENVIKKTALDRVARFYREASGIAVPIIDLRKMRYEYGKGGIVDSRFEMAGDPLGYSAVNLRNDSEFGALRDHSKIYGADYDREETQKHHNSAVNEYLVSNTILSADVMINLPKLKVHRKAGLSLNLKLLIGINGDKNWLPHFLIGEPGEGGDEVPARHFKGMEKLVYRFDRQLIDKFMAKRSPLREKTYLALFKVMKNTKVVWQHSAGATRVRAGDWYGNDTIWRTIVDLNKIARYADKQGVMQGEPQRSFFSIIDGVVVGEKEGPLVPTSKGCGLICSGFDPFAVDIVTTKLVGFDYRKMPQYREPLENMEQDKYPISGLLRSAEDVERIDVKSNIAGARHIDDIGHDESLHLIPPKGWEGYVELGSGCDGE